MGLRKSNRLRTAAAGVLGVLVALMGFPAMAEELLVMAQDRPDQFARADRAVIVAGPDAAVAAGRLSDLSARDAKVALKVLPPGSPVPADRLPIYLATLGAAGDLGKDLPDGVSELKLKPEGFFIASRGGGRPGVWIVGADRDGLRYGVGEFWNYHVKIDDKRAYVPADLRVQDAPVFSKRILWNWNFMTNWDEQIPLIHQTQAVDPNGKRQPYLEQPDGYVEQFTRVIDYAADHKLNGLIIWGFINDAHGGVESAKRLSAYARQQSVRVLPGVGTVIYGGFYHGGQSPYSLTHWMQNNPDVPRMIGKDGKTIEAPCPSAPELHAFLREGSRWFFTTFTEIGGVNLEHGDFFECHCDRCKAGRAEPGNDPNFLWDMMTTQLPVLEEGLKINPNLWFTFSPYWGYNAQMMENPPKFLARYPEQAIVQWTYTGMVAAPENWPATLKPPAGARHSIGLLHQGSYWYTPRQWWGSPGQTYALIPDIIQKACARAIDDGSEGLEIVGQIGSASPQNEMNYLAFEAFTWNPKLSWDEWFARRLPAIYGSEELARAFYELLADETVSTEAIEAARTKALSVAAELRDPRQVNRWKNLAEELRRRSALVKAGLTKPFGPGPLEGVEDVQLD